MTRARWWAAAAVLLLALMSGLDVLGPGSASAAGPDPDADGLTTTFETAQSHTDPQLADTDGDGTPDGSEDPDGDGLVNVWEQRLKLDPLSADTDGDGRSDAREDPDGDRLGNRFEIRSARTSPLSADSDRDGIRDGAEDPDLDALSNAGEYRYRTDPRDPDTDADGLNDWHEDSNEDGVRDGLTQDAVRVPRGLTPSLADPNDRPRSWYSCHQGHGDTAPKVCVVGTTGPKVLVFGDSHALQWRAPLERVAKERGWRLYFLTKSGCPVARIALPAPDCARWRTRALDRIKAIRPDMIIASELNIYPVLGATGVHDNAVRWRTGLRSTLKALGTMSAKVVLLGDTPRWIDAATCLPKHLDDVSACAQRRSVGSGLDRIANDRAAAKAAGATYVKTIGLVCPYDPCPPVIDHLLVAYDGGHMTHAFSRTLWRGLEARLPTP